MKFAMIGAFLITLPAIAALVFGLIWQNWYIVIAATASVLINTLPFVAAGLMLRRSGDTDLSH
jgi:hypothetical protein